MKKLLFVLFTTGAVLLGSAVVHAADAAARPAKKLKVFLLAGQSNMEGKGDGGKITAEERALLTQIQPRVHFAYNHEPMRPLDVTPAGGNKKRFGVDTTFGPEMFFGLKVAEAWPDEEILLIKRSVGATSLYGRWNPQWTKEKAAVTEEDKASPLYPDFIGYVKEILSKYPKDSYEICAMLWVQGESDTAHGPIPPPAYGDNLRNLINQVRSDVSISDLPFIFVEVGSGKVLEGMEKVAHEMPNVVAIPRAVKDESSPYFFPQYPVGHYNYEGQKRIGSLIAAAYLKDFAARVKK